MPLVASAQAELTVTAVNKLNIARQSETIELTVRDLAPLAEKDLTKLHVRDSSGRELLAQSVDTDYDEYRKPDILIFQADFKPRETKTFTVFAGAKREYKKEDFRAYGRFVRERFDDFAWENDRIAHRTYGRALLFGKVNHWSAARSTSGPSGRRSWSSTIGTWWTTTTPITARALMSIRRGRRVAAVAAVSGATGNSLLPQTFSTRKCLRMARSA